MQNYLLNMNNNSRSSNMKWYLISGGVVVLVVILIILLSSKKQKENWEIWDCEQYANSEWGYDYETFYKDCKDFIDKILDDNIKYVQTLPNDYTTVWEYARLTNEYALKEKYISQEEYNSNEDKVKEFTIDLLKNIYM